MKKSSFVLLFTIISISLLYSPYSQSAQSTKSCLNYTKSNCPSPQCQLVTTSISKPGCSKSSPLYACVSNLPDAVPNPINKFCYPSDTKDLIPSSQSQKTIPANFIYDNVKSIYWEFLVQQKDAKVNTPYLLYNGELNKQFSFTTKEGTKSDNCKYYSFTYFRTPQSITFTVSSISPKPEIVDGEATCLYGDSTTSKYIANILSLGSTASTTLNLNYILSKLAKGEGIPLKEICNDFNNAPSQSNICSSSQNCKVNINQGPQSYYGFSFEKDSCGNRIVLPDNNGQPISYAEISQRAQKFISECSKKYELNPLTAQVCKNGKNAQGEVCVCGNGNVEPGEECDEGLENGKGFCTTECKAEFPDYCKKTDPIGIVFCKECLDNKNRFGLDKNKKKNDGCSYLEKNKLIPKPDGVDCKLWQQGGNNPKKWDADTVNTAWGICKGGVCVHDVSALPSGKSCSCQCNGKTIGWDEYCTKTSEMCSKKKNAISTLKGNICELTEKLNCVDEQGNFISSPKDAKEQCERQGKLFYSVVFTKPVFEGINPIPGIGIKRVECQCDPKPDECKPIKPQS